MHYLCSFRMERIGAATITWAGTPVSISSGRYAHVSMASYESTCVAFATVLQAALVTAGFATATVSYSTSTHRYTLSNGGGSFAIAFPGTGAGTCMKQILGFSTGATATSHTSTIRPHYVNVPQHDGRSQYKGLAREQRSTRRAADDGRGFALGPTSVPRVGMWEHWHEAASATLADRASSSAPFTWEHLWDHAGRWQELVRISPPSGDPEPAGIWQLRTPDFDESTHEPQYPNQHGVWKVRVSAVRLGDA